MKRNKHSTGCAYPPRFSPAPEIGLTSAQAAQRAVYGCSNTAPASLSKTTRQIIFDNVATPFNLLFCILAACLIAVKAYGDVLFVSVVVLNVLIGIVQELRVKRTLDRITLLCAPTAHVVRDGAVCTLPVEELVLDDIVQFTAGAQIPADAIVCDGMLEVNEALLTGEADTVYKRCGDLLLSGSFVVSGQCRARLDRVGADAYAARITQEAKRNKKNRSQMMASLDKMIRLIGIALVPLGLVMFFKQYLILQTGIEYSVISTVAAVVGMIPEGLYLLVSIALTVGVLNLARRKTLVHELSCIENLARVDTLCLDKTGTLTQGSMEVVQVMAAPGFSQQDLEDTVSAFVGCGSDKNATSLALQAYFPPCHTWEGAREIAFSSARKWSARCAPDGYCYLLGAPDVLLGQEHAQALSLVQEYLAQGYRVLALVRTLQPPEGNQLISSVSPLGFLVLSDKIRDDAKDTLAFFRKQGVQIKVISGDNAACVAEIARRAGVLGAERFIDASQLENDAALRAAANRYTVFGRVTPEQKRVLIRALKDAGRTVAMTGDGVNDVLALKDADCSIAMASGSEAAQQVAQLVLMDSSFASMPHIVNEGRRVINNIERSAALFLVKNIFSFVISFLLLFIAMPYPFIPLQLSTLSIFTIGIPSFILTLEPCYKKASGNFISTVLLRAIPGGLTNVFCILLAMAACTFLHLPLAQLSTICTLMAGYVGMLVLHQVCKPFNLLRYILLAAMSLTFLVIALLFSGWLGLVPLVGNALAVLGGLVIAAPLIFAGLTRLMKLVRLRLRRGAIASLRRRVQAHRLSQTY